MPTGKRSLFELAVAYVNVIERIIRHNQFADALKAVGISYKDREHVTRIAFRIAKQEL